VYVSVTGMVDQISQAVDLSTIQLECL